MLPLRLHSSLCLHRSPPSPYLWTESLFLTPSTHPFPFHITFTLWLQMATLSVLCGSNTSGWHSLHPVVCWQLIMGQGRWLAPHSVLWPKWLKGVQRRRDRVDQEEEQGYLSVQIHESVVMVKTIFSQKKCNLFNLVNIVLFQTNLFSPMNTFNHHSWVNRYYVVRIRDSADIYLLCVRIYLYKSGVLNVGASLQGVLKPADVLWLKRETLE